MMDDVLNAVERRWAAMGAVRGPAVSAEELAGFEARLGVRLPGEARAYFLALNGSENGRDEMLGDELIAFWNLSQVRRLQDELPGFLPADGETHLVFADHLIWSHAYVLRVRNGDETAPVFVSCDFDRLVPAAPSLAAFLRGYAAEDQGTLFPSGPAAWPVGQERWWDEVPAGDAHEEPPVIANRRSINRLLTRFARAYARTRPELAEGGEAVVTLYLHVGADGVPLDVQVVEPPGDPWLEREALRAGTRMRFTPAAVNGRRVAVHVRIPLTFTWKPSPLRAWWRRLRR